MSMGTDENRELLQEACEAHGWELREMPPIPGELALTTVTFRDGAVLSAKTRSEEGNAEAIVAALIEVGGVEVFEP